MKYGNRSTWSKVVSSPFSMVALIILTVILGRAVFGIHEKANISKDRLTKAESELQKLKERQTEISEKVALLSTEQGIEAEIRSKYHAVREGESVAVIVDSQQVANASSVVVTDISDADLSWWRRLMRWFGF